MNIDDLYTVDKHEAGAEMQVENDKGDKLDMFITVVGVDSKLFRKVKNDLRRKILTSSGDVDDEALRAASMSLVTLGWRGFLNKGKEYKFTPKAAEKLYLNAPYLMEQVDDFINNRLNFSKG